MPDPLYYEDWEIGRRYETAAREVTLREFELFAEVEGHKAALHLDEEYAKNHSVFGKLTAHGILTLAMSAGLMGDMGLFDGTALAFLRMTWEFHAPGLPGRQDPRSVVGVFEAPDEQARAGDRRPRYARPQPG